MLPKPKITKKYTRDECYSCDKPIQKSEDGFFIPVGTTRSRASSHVQVAQVCEICWLAESAVADAEVEGRRFTEVDCSNRCPCGAVTHPKLGWCVRCWKDSRMLCKKEAEAKANRNIINQLKAVIQNVKDKDHRRAS